MFSKSARSTGRNAADSPRVNAPRFTAFYQAATEKPAPYDYQVRLAGGDEGRACESLLIDVPTGLGKTAAVVLAWLWNRILRADETWPRRLVYCLPMRTLVEQTRDEVGHWIENIEERAIRLGADESVRAQLAWLKEHSPVILMGGEENDRAHAEWDIHPEKPAILIGTQDMLLSRALNRGYGMARARWPMHFGLLNNDALWVLDETQLMGVGLRTSAQLEGLRGKLGVAASCFTWWSSATQDARPLATPDHRFTPATLALTADDLALPAVADRVSAGKRLTRLPFKLTVDNAKALATYLDQLAAAVVEKHQPQTTTIVILNRVDRARDLFALLEKLAKKRSLPPRVLVHSRFRLLEREALSGRIKTPDEKIIVATQAIEAGVDISARTLFTELAPWSSLVQRFGRCNRKGEYNSTGGADLFWIDLTADEKASAAALALPYETKSFDQARTALSEVVSGAPESLARIRVDEPLPEAHILRRKDLVELFDTTPDLAGLDLDVGRYIRDDEDRDVQVFWRDISPKPTEGELDAIQPQRIELVRVAIHPFRKFLEKSKGRSWCWQALEGEWQPARADRLAPGQVYLVARDAGGYSETLGWTGEPGQPFPVLSSTTDQASQATPRDGQGHDDESRLRDAAAAWQSVEQHTARVVAACEEKLRVLPHSRPWSGEMLTAARWHDVGKAHACFQAFIVAGREVPPELLGHFVAKAPVSPGAKHGRPYFRHELASALAWLRAGDAENERTKSLVAYLIATHHGKIRLSIRAMPGELSPPLAADGTSWLYARGVWDQDRLPADPTKQLALDWFPHEPVTLDLSCMQMGEQGGDQSWTARALALRDSPELGLFRLAWLEALLRAADAEGSKA